MEEERKRLQETLDEELEEELEEEREGVSIKYGKEKMDKYLNNEGDIKRLESYDLELPSYYRNISNE